VGECGVSLSEARGGGPGSSLRRAEAAGAFVYLAVETGWPRGQQKPVRAPHIPTTPRDPGSLT
jgi:hypothetical protein